MYKGTEHQPKGASVVYWIHKPQHTDIFKEGYVGITHNMVIYRWVDHKRASRKNPDNHCAIVNNAIRKHLNLIYEVVLVADTREYCERIEGLLRPINHKGWNISRGGMPVDSIFGGIANKKRWIKFWIDNPIEASNRWWKTECNLLKKQATVQQIAQRQANKHVPFTLDRKHDSRNKSGYAGVSWFPKYGKWRAQIGMMPITIGLGYFESQEQAHQIFLKAKAIRLMWRQGCINRECAITQIKALQKGKVS